ncbi:MAG: hypothetical protein GC189_02110 [Alphaproteobacteria bacterium]|nr:hypothetical protein [Alphaproteobacteria bacterium]
MAKVIVERPRYGHADGRVRQGRTAALMDDDGEPFRARAPQSDRLVKTKTLNENLSPLKRYLRAQVNRPWGKVYSEIAQHLRPTSTVQQHVIDHIQDFVAVRTFMRDGKVFTAGRRWGGPPTPLEQDYRELFVHPKTGLLRRNPHWVSWSRRAFFQRSKEREPKIVSLGPFRVAVRIKGAWFEAHLEPAPIQERAGVQGERARVIVARFEDAILGSAWSFERARECYGRDDVFAETLRPLNAAERKALRLPR